MELSGSDPSHSGHLFAKKIVDKNGKSTTRWFKKDHAGDEGRDVNDLHKKELSIVLKDKSLKEHHSSVAKAIAGKNSLTKKATTTQSNQVNTNSVNQTSDHADLVKIKFHKSCDQYFKEHDIPKDNVALLNMTGGIYNENYIPTSVRITPYKDYDFNEIGLQMEVRSKNHIANVQWLPKDKSVYIELIKKNPKMKDDDFGSNWLATVIKSGQDMKYRSVKLNAKGSGKYSEEFRADAQQYQGYYVWPRLGFSMQEEENKRFKKWATDNKVNAESISDLFKDATGRKEWLERGFPHKATFDLEKDSLNMQIFNAYLGTKKQ